MTQMGADIPLAVLCTLYAVVSEFIGGLAADDSFPLKLREFESFIAAMSNGLAANDTDKRGGLVNLRPSA
jgi:hypothetical protein